MHLLLIVAAAASAILVAAALRLPSLVSTALVAYLAYVANVGLVTLALSPFRAVTSAGLTAAELVLLAAALAAWSLRGRPRPPLAGARAAAGRIVSDPVTALFLAVTVAVLAYELVLGLAVPPNNMDSLTYHLVKAAAWAQHGGLYWIPHAPEIEINEYQPFAEQQQLFLMVATGGGALFALPQYLAELAILVACYGSARRLGFEVRAAACASFLLATFSVFALEAMTAQVDLVAASFPAVAACLLLGDTLVEAGFAGLALALGLGTKATVALALPFVAWLALLRGRRRFGAALIGGALGFVAIGMWGYVLNWVHTGDPLGAGSQYLEHRASPAYPRSLANLFDLLYGTMDLSVLSDHLIEVLAAIGVVAALAAGGLALHRAGRRRALVNAAGVATPFLAPLLVLAGADVVAFVAGEWGLPIRGPAGILAPLDANLNEVYTRFANEDFSAYGPLGIVALLLAAVLAVRAYRARRADARFLVLASAFPGFLILLSLQVWWAPFLIRFFTIPAALAAPLLALLFTNRATTTAYLAVAALTIGLTITRDQTKPLQSGAGWVWQLDQRQALWVNSDSYVDPSLAAYDALVPARACVGAVVGENEPSYLLFGNRLGHRVTFLPDAGALDTAYLDHLFYVVISPGAYPSVAGAFAASGWRVRPLGQMWLLASEPGAGAGTCTV